MPCVIRGMGSALPERVVLSEEIESALRLEPRTLSRLFDIESRHWSRGVDSCRPVDGQTCSSLAAAAARKALDSAGLCTSDIGMLIVASSTPDYLNPSLDYFVGQKLGLPTGLRFSIQAPCTGLFRSLLIAQSMLYASTVENVLIVTAETVSPFFSMDPAAPLDQKLSFGLYADGAGALVMSREGAGPRLLLAECKTYQSDDRPGLFFPGRLSAQPDGPHDRIDRSEVGYHDFRRVLRRGGELTACAIREAISSAGWASESVKKIITHQATGKMNRIAEIHSLPATKIATNIDHVGNTISASILILLDELARESTFERDDKVVLATAESSSWSSGFGALQW